MVARVLILCGVCTMSTKYCNIAVLESRYLQCSNLGQLCECVLIFDLQTNCKKMSFYGGWGFDPSVPEDALRQQTVVWIPTW